MANTPRITKHGVRYWTTCDLAPSCPECNSANVTTNIIDVEPPADLECRCSSCNCCFNYADPKK